MSATQVTVGIGVLSTVLVAALGAVLPRVPAITVHHLVYEDGIVVQDRTVVAEGDAFYASWAAVVIDAETNEPLRWCDGSGAWPYKTGHVVAELPLAEWTGSDACTPESLPAGEYYLKASWAWGNEQTSAQSDVFTVP